jgi:hypothetical protein
LRTQRVAVRYNVHTAIFSFRRDKRRVVPHAAEKGGDQVLELIGVLGIDVLLESFYCPLFDVIIRRRLWTRPDCTGLRVFSLRPRTLASHRRFPSHGNVCCFTLR